MVLLLVWLVGNMLPQQAFAYDFDNPYGVYQISNPLNTIDIGNKRVCSLDSTLSWSDNLKKYGLVKRVILCIRESTVSAVSKVLLPFSKFFSRLIAIMCSLVVVVWGVMMASGRKTAPTQDGLIMGLKIGLVIMFTSNFAALYFDPANHYGGFFGLILDAMGQMLTMLTYYAPFFFSNPCDALTYDSSTGFYVDALTGRGDLAIWDFIDCTLDSLIGGIFSPITLSGGMVGFFVSCILSSVAGIFIGILGFMIISMLLSSITKAVYIFISSYIALALMVVVSPMLIPLALFEHTKAYFEKWLKLTIGFILQPIFIFVYITMFMTAFDVTLYSGQRSVVRAVLGNQVDDADYKSRGFGKYLLWRGYYSDLKMGQTGVQLNYNPLPSSCNEGAGCATKPSNTKFDSGVLGLIGQEVVTDTGAWQRDIYEVLGDQNIFKTSIPFKGIDWDWMVINYDVSAAYYADMIEAYIAYDHCRTNPDAGCASNPDPLHYLDNYYYPYMVRLILALIMAVVTTYIFKSMLEYLPFIGSGISGESLSMPTFGVGKFAPIGGQTLSKIKDRLSGNLLKGGAK